VTAKLGPAPLARLRSVLTELDRVVVALSGGADSAFLAWVANDTLGPERVLCATAVSASLPESEREQCAALAAAWRLRWVGVETNELEDPAYVANGADRCARCKTALMDVLGPLAVAEGATVVLGVNTDDLADDHRPGQAAAASAGARFPLVEAGFSKAAIREWSRRMALSTWDKPAAACLASRVPYGTPVTAPTLRAVERAEAALHALGFSDCRVRHHGPVARVEIPEDQLTDAFARRAEVVAAVRGAGYRFVALDLEGFSSGRMNRLLEPVAVGTVATVVAR
jgi:pyridinium-3,5-biscarboxylic acid mononucleotide sulfurtransferase